MTVPSFFSFFGGAWGVRLRGSDYWFIGQKGWGKVVYPWAVSEITKKLIHLLPIPILFSNRILGPGEPNFINCFFTAMRNMEEVGGCHNLMLNHKLTGPDIFYVVPPNRLDNWYTAFVNELGGTVTKHVGRRKNPVDFVPMTIACHDGICGAWITCAWDWRFEECAVYCLMDPTATQTQLYDKFSKICEAEGWRKITLVP